MLKDQQYPRRFFWSVFAASLLATLALLALIYFLQPGTPLKLTLTLVAALPILPAYAALKCLEEMPQNPKT